MFAVACEYIGEYAHGDQLQIADILHEKAHDRHWGQRDHNCVRQVDLAHKLGDQAQNFPHAIVEVLHVFRLAKQASAPAIAAIGRFSVARRVAELVGQFAFCVVCFGVRLDCLVDGIVMREYGIGEVYFGECGDLFNNVFDD